MEEHGLKKNGLILNPKKSGVVEFIWGGCKTRALSPKSKIGGIPVEDSYRYLGLYLDSKLTIHTHLGELKEKLIYQAGALGGVLFQFPAGYRKDLWGLMVRPLFELPALLCVGGAKSNIEIAGRICRKSFKRMTGMAPKTGDELVGIPPGYNLGERGGLLWKESEDKWYSRRQGMVPSRGIKVGGQEDLLAYVPNEAIKLFNQYTRMCPLCIGGKMNPGHMKNHGLNAPGPITLARWVNQETLKDKKITKRKGSQFKRIETMKYYGI